MQVRLPKLHPDLSFPIGATLSSSVVRHGCPSEAEVKSFLCTGVNPVRFRKTTDSLGDIESEVLLISGQTVFLKVQSSCPSTDCGLHYRKLPLCSGTRMSMSACRLSRPMLWFEGCYHLDLVSSHDMLNNALTLPHLPLLSQPFHSSVHHPCSVLVLFRLSHVRQDPHFH
jgi:hypothetical protein